MQTAEDQKLLMQFLGQTYSALKQIDADVTERSSNIGNASSQFKQTVQTITHNIPQNTPRSFSTQSRDESLPLTVNEPAVLIDPNQLEFNFSNSVTARTINDKIDKLYEKFSHIEKLIIDITQLLQNKRKKKLNYNL